MRGKVVETKVKGAVGRVRESYRGSMECDRCKVVSHAQQRSVVWLERVSKEYVTYEEKGTRDYQQPDVVSFVTVKGVLLEHLGVAHTSVFQDMAKKDARIHQQ